MKIYLANDTSNGHAGCKAVMNSIKNVLNDHEIIKIHKVGSTFDIEDIKKCDIVIVNGEGTIHHDKRAGNILMEILKTGQQLGKKTILINAVFQQIPPFYTEVLKKLDYFAVREILSRNNAIACGGNPELLLDSSADPINRNGKAFGDCKGQIVRGKTFPGLPHSKVIEQLKEYPIIVTLRNQTFADIIVTLKTAKLYITGQHHGVYVAGLAGIPFVCLPGNTHKIEGIIKWSELPIKVCTTVEEVREQIKWALEHKEVYDKFHEFLINEKIFDRDKLEKILWHKNQNNL